MAQRKDARSLLLAKLLFLVISATKEVLLSTEFERLNETEKIWHKNLINFTLGDDIGTEKFTCLLSPHRCCSCSNNCISLGTCCIDKWFLKEPMPTEEYLEMIRRKVYAQPKTSCLPILVGIPGEHVIQHINQVASCPTELLSEALNFTRYSLCETEYQHYFRGGIVKPSLVVSDDVFYRNEHCAICNGANDFQRVNITVKDCALREGARYVRNMTLDDLSYCTFQTSLPATNCPTSSKLLRPSNIGGWKDYSENCSKDEFEMCFIYARPVLPIASLVSAEQKAYANKHCLHCMANESNIKQVSCWPPTDVFVVGASGYSAIISFSSFEKPPQIISPCPEDALFDIHTRKCFRILRCVSPFKLTSKGCELTEDYMVMPSVPNSTEVSIGASIGDPIWREEFIRCTLSSIRATIYAKSLLGTVLLERSIDPTLAWQLRKKADTLERIIEFINYSYNQSSAIEVVTLSSNPIETTWLYGSSEINVFSNHRICSNVVDLTNHVLINPNCTSSVSSNVLNIVDLASYFGQTIPFEMAAFRIDYARNETLFKFNYCKEFHLISNCTVRVYSPDAFLILGNKSALINPSSPRMLKPSEYIPLENGIGSCILASENKFETSHVAWQRILRKAVEVSSTTGTLLSLVALLLTVLILCSYKVLCTESGKYVINLSMALIISDSLVLTGMHGNLTGDFCKAVGILLHFSLLAQHLCCLVLAVSFTWSFSSQVKLERNTSKKAFLVSLLIWGTSAVFVFLCALLDGYAGKVMQYGHDNVCWIYARRGRIYGYLVPALIILLVNTALFILALKKIHRAKKDVQSVLKVDRKEESRFMILLSIRLCALLGLVEVIALFQIFTTDAPEALKMAFDLVYSTARSLRGFLLFISFTARRRVFRLISISFARPRTSILKRSPMGIELQSKSKSKVHSSVTISSEDGCSQNL